MNMHELPMIIFTVVAQMCVGAFIILGGLQLWLGQKTDAKTADRLTIPILYVIGPLLILGLITSMFHMNDITNTINVIRHWQSSWLTREILFGVGFAAAGFLFAFMQWFRIGSQNLRTTIAIIAAAIGIGLVWSMSQIYASLETVPAWNTWVVPVQFFATALLLGAALIGVSLLITAVVRNNTEKKAAANKGDTPAGKSGRGGTALEDANAVIGDTGSLMTKLRITETKNEINAPMRDEEWTLTRTMIQILAVITALAGVVIMISYIFHLQDLATGNATAQASAEVFSGSFFTWRLILLAIGSVLSGFILYQAAGTAVRDNPTPLAWISAITFIILLAGEMMGRSLHYDSMLRIGM